MVTTGWSLISNNFEARAARAADWAGVSSARKDKAATSAKAQTIRGNL